MSALIKVMEAEEGKKYDETGEAIASFKADGSRHWSIVFLPKGTEPGKYYRVQLHEIREDSRGVMMYRATPAPPEYKESWRDNGGGTISGCKIEIDWKLNESFVEVLVTRKKDRRSRVYSTRNQDKLVLGPDKASCYIENRSVEDIWEEEEGVHDGRLVWVKICERQNIHPAERKPVEIRLTGGEFQQKCLEPAYLANWTVQAEAVFRLAGRDWDESIMLDAQVYLDLPGWYRRELEEEIYPLCPCGRSRFAALEGEGQCAACVQEDQKMCFFSEHLPEEKREQITALAEKLLGAKCLNAEEVKLFLPHLLNRSVPDRWERENIVRACSAYLFCYITPQGDVYGSKFAPEALEFVKMIDMARGDGLLKLAAWLSGPQKTAACRDRDYYWRTQIQGQPADMPDLASLPSDFQVGQRLFKAAVEPKQSKEPAAVDERDQPSHGKVTMADLMAKFNS